MLNFNSRTATHYEMDLFYNLSYKYNLADRKYKYEIIVDSKPMILPDFIYREIIKHHKSKPNKIIQNKKSTKHDNDICIRVHNENDEKLRIIFELFE